MNYRFVLNQLGLLLIVLAVILLGVAIFEALDFWLGDRTAQGLALTATLCTTGIGLVIGGAMWMWGRSQAKAHFGRHEALLLVALSWIVGGALAAAPFYIWAHLNPDIPTDHPFLNLIDCYFEGMSGLTTTGATILSDIESVPRGLLLWRSLTHWLGGLGIVVLFVAVLPTVGVGGKKLFHTEAAGPQQAGVRPRIAETARVLWLIYLGLTIVMILALRFTGMNWFDSVCHTFSCVSSGGFSTKDASVGAFNTGSTLVVMVFMVLAGVNFGLYYQLLRGSVSSIWKDTELRFYLGMIAFGAVVIIGSIMYAGRPLASTQLELDAAGEPIMTMQRTLVVNEFGDKEVVEFEVPKRVQLEPTFANAAEYGVFNSISIHTGTGFCTIDYNRWPMAAKAVLWMLMIFGGCAGSTTGGIKVVRVWLSLKIVLAELERVFRPNVIRPLKFGKVTVDRDLKLQVITYAVAFVLIWIGGSFVVMLFESHHPRCDYATAASASLATLGNIGPGFQAVGAVENFAWMSGPTKLLLTLFMALGRLEIFAIVVLLHPGFWRGK